MATRTRPNVCCALTPAPALRSDTLKEMVVVAKALADSNRLQIYRLLASQQGPVCVCDIVAQSELSQPTVSHHLKVLRDAGLLRSKRQGLWVFYETVPVEASPLADLMRLLA